MNNLTKAEANRRIANKEELEEDLMEELDDDFSEQYREKRLQEFRLQAQKLEEMKENAHGVYSEITNEKDFLNITTKTPFVIIHFYHPTFQRCQIVDKHLQSLAKKHFGTKFAKISVEIAPFFIQKLKVQVLPCIIMFVDGVAMDRIVGFDELGGKDDFKEGVLEKRLAKCGVIAVDGNNMFIKPKSSGKLPSNLAFEFA